MNGWRDQNAGSGTIGRVGEGETRPRGVGRFAAPGLGALAAVLLMEVVVRDVYSVRTTKDSEIGVIYDPASPVRWRREGNGTSHWDARGVRRNGRELAGAADTTILVRGDSFTEALMVDDGEAYPSILQDALQAAGLDAAVVNVGRSTDSAADHVAHAARSARVFAPDWVVVQVRQEDFAREAFDDTGARFVNGSDGALSLVAAPLTGSTVRGALGSLERRSMLVAYGLLRAAEMEKASRNQPPMFRGADGPPPPPPKDDRVYPVADELAAIRDAYAGRVTFVWLTDRKPAASEAIFDRFCGKSGASCVNMRAPFAALRESGHSAYGFANTVPDSGHMNVHGHRAVAAALADELLRLRKNGLL